LRRFDHEYSVTRPHWQTPTSIARGSYDITAIGDQNAGNTRIVGGALAGARLVTKDTSERLARLVGRRCRQRERDAGEERTTQNVTPCRLQLARVHAAGSARRFKSPRATRCVAAIRDSCASWPTPALRWCARCVAHQRSHRSFANVCSTRFKAAEYEGPVPLRTGVIGHPLGRCRCKRTNRNRSRTT
jgi:hypothetical protein